MLLYQASYDIFKGHALKDPNFLTKDGNPKVADCMWFRVGLLEGLV
jgi:hypothetical protein